MLLTWLKRLLCPEIKDLKLQIARLKEELEMTKENLNPLNLEENSNPYTIWIKGIIKLSKVYRYSKELFTKFLELTVQIIEKRLLQKPAPKPDWLVEGRVYEPMFETHGQYIREKPRDIFGPGYQIYQIVKPWLSLSIEERLRKIWEFVILKINYVYDEYEHFYRAEETLAFGGGDCEDTTILFTTLCHAAEIPEDRVFCVMGYFDTYGHAFPICKHDDGKWYIYETTLSRVPNAPILFKNSRYTSPPTGGIGGMYNWEYKGVISEGRSQI